LTSKKPAIRLLTGCKVLNIALSFDFIALANFPPGRSSSVTTSTFMMSSAEETLEIVSFLLLKSLSLSHLVKVTFDKEMDEKYGEDQN
jgi:hypothetical protein